MARIAVAHADLMAKGGGEGVCVNVVAALAEDHDVTLLTLTEPDWPELTDYFDAALPHVAVRPAPTVARLFDRVEDPLHNLRLAALNRHVRRHEAPFDLVVGTDNELSVRSPSVQYVHTPRFGRLVTTKRVGEDAFVDHLYDRLSYRVGGYDAERLRSARLLTNSRYMANVVQDAYGVRPQVVHPPVDTRGFADVPWAEREAGFLTVGRLAPYKNVEATIRVVDGLRERGHDVHQHVVGPAYDDAYAREIESMAADRGYVHLEGELPRDELVELVSRHRYGLHGKRNEHFGMVVAELAAAGAVPFVPDSGGQREIVEAPAHQSYATPADAVDRIDRVLSDSDLQARLRTGPGEIERRFGRERFRETVREIVADALAEAPSAEHTARITGK